MKLPIKGKTGANGNFYKITLITQQNLYTGSCTALLLGRRHEHMS